MLRNNLLSCGLLGLAGLLLNACVPIPIPRTSTIRPGLKLTVLDAVKNKAIKGVSVQVRRFRVGPPPREETHRWSTVTNSKGKMSLSHTREREWVMPLMMHGVPQWGWEVCLLHKGFVPRVLRLRYSLRTQSPNKPLRLSTSLRPTSKPGKLTCPWRKLSIRKPPSGSKRH